MKKIITLILFLTLLASAAGQMIVLTPEKEANAKKYAKLRLDYANSKDYDPYDREYDKALEKAGKLFHDEKKQEEALAILEPFLKKNPYCIPVLQTKAAMLREMGRIKEADEARQAWFGIVDSILASGDGRTPETAMQVITVAEEYSVLRVLKLRCENQILINKEGHQYDVMTVCGISEPKDSDKTFDLYFNVDLPFNSLNQKFSEKADSETKPKNEIKPKKKK